METKNEEKKTNDQYIDQTSDSRSEGESSHPAEENQDDAPEALENYEENNSESNQILHEDDDPEKLSKDTESIRITPLFDEDGNFYDDPPETLITKPKQSKEPVAIIESETDDKEEAPAVKSEGEPVDKEEAPEVKPEAESDDKEEAPAVKSEAEPVDKEEVPAVKSEVESDDKEEAPAVKSEAEPDDKEEAPAVRSEAESDDNEEAPAVRSEAEPVDKEEAPAVKLEAEPDDKEEAPEVKSEVESDDKEEALVVKSEVESDDKGDSKGLSDEDEDEDEEDYSDYTSFSKVELVSALEEVVNNEDAVRYRQKIGKIKLAYNNIENEIKDKALTRFLSEGGKKEDFTYTPDDLDNRFHAALLIYKEKKQKHLEKLEEIKKENLAKKLEILNQIKELINSEEPLKKTYDEFRSFQDKWREIGNVPKSAISDLWQSYHFLVEKFLDKVKINNELRDLDMKKNLEKKIELCEKAEELLLETSVIKSFKQLQRYHQEWKDIGSVPHDKSDELWERFKAATDKINERRKSYYEKIYEEQENNLVAKRALCEKAEEVLAKTPEKMSEWQTLTNDVNELMKMWKSLGPAPRQHNDDIYKRFKTTIDEFYRQKKDHYNEIKEEQLNNYNLKLNICQQAEVIAESSDWRETTQELIRLQKEWKSIGPVPRRHSDKIWKRFRKACDTFFERKQEHFAGRKISEEENLKKKEELIEKINRLEVGSDREESLKTIKDIQRQFIETGHVPFKKKNQIQNDFREAINKKLDQLKIDPEEITAHVYRIQLESMPGKATSKERGFILQRIKKLENDIILWENNMGFLADSAAADVLKKEFEKKIKKSKDEIVFLNTKLKVLDESSKTKKRE